MQTKLLTQIRTTYSDLNIKKDEKAVLKAFFEKNISKLENEEKSVLVLNLIAISKDLGVKESVETEQAKRIAKFIAEYYPKLSVEAIRIAFNMALTGTIKVDAEHYQSFDKKYISKVLNAYNDYQANVIKKVSDEAQKVERIKKEEEEMKKRNTPEFQQEMYEGLINYIQEYDELPDAWDFFSCYKHMMRSGMIKATVEELREFMERQRAKVKAELNRAKIENNRFNEMLYTRINVDENAFKSYWRAEYVKHLMKI